VNRSSPAGSTIIVCLLVAHEGRRNDDEGWVGAVAPAQRDLGHPTRVVSNIRLGFERASMDRHEHLAAKLDNLFIVVEPLAKGLPCAACGETIGPDEDGYFYVSVLTGLPGVATHAKEPCCFAWLTFDNRRGRLVADA
jgi:hypothetical protein